MRSINLLGSAPKVVRDIRSRRADKERNRELALKFGREYFDGPRERGYGGYVYDGRWVAVAKRLVEIYGLKPGHKVLDIGCAKGFLVKDLTDVLPSLEVWGLDISAYALANAHLDAAGRLVRGSCDSLPFADGTFDLALAINTVHNLDYEGCLRSLREIVRVSPRYAFVQVDAYRNETEREIFEDWMLTAKTYLTPEGWLDLFRKAGYRGDYYWTVLLPEGEVL